MSCEAGQNFGEVLANRVHTLRTQRLRFVLAAPASATFLGVFRPLARSSGRCGSTEAVGTVTSAWVNGEVYEPLHKSQKLMSAVA